MTEHSTESEIAGSNGGHRLEFLPGDDVDPEVIRACAAELGALFATGASQLTLDRRGDRETVPFTELEDLQREPFTAIALASTERAQLPWRWQVRLAGEHGGPIVLELPRDTTHDRPLDAELPANARLVHLDARASARRRGAFLPAVLSRAQLDPATFHALAAWAFQHGAFRAVHWLAPDDAVRATWRSLDDIPAGIARAVRALHGHPAEARGDLDAVAPAAIDASLHERLTAVAGDPAAEAQVLAARADLRVEVVTLRDLAPCAFRTPAPDDAVLVVAPTPDAVRIALSPRVTRAERVQAILHAWAHVTLGHVRPGDTLALWDTAATIATEHPHRRWDREVRASFGQWFDPPKPTCLDECSPRDKAMLGLHRMIRDRLGGAEALHEAAQRYQHAAYQRQAAQRLVAQLEATRGAMLCDGVGLGKTYVATTVLVHYAHVAREEPLRVTILAPGSVVGTWEREAIPPLARHGVDLARVRVISHAKLSRVTPGSALLTPGREALSDLEHLIQSDLVIVDEAHNFRAASARRTQVLRDILRLRMRRGRHRRVLLLTATPINNSLDDLAQECSLLFAEPYAFPAITAKTERAWDEAARKELARRCERARGNKRRQADVIEEILHGPDGRVRGSFDFRADLHLGTHDLARYLKDQEAELQALRTRIREAAERGSDDGDARPRIAEELLDRVVVQRSRALCKAIEAQEGSDVSLLFRRDPGAPEQLRYEDAYQGTQSVLERFLPLFGEGSDERPALGFEIYRCREAELNPESLAGPSPAVGLQRVLALKRLESSPVAFLITVLRLTVRHTAEVESIIQRAMRVGLHAPAAELTRRAHALYGAVPEMDRRRIHWLVVGSEPGDTAGAFARSLAAASAQFDDDEPEARQFDLFGHDAKPEDTEERARVERLLALRAALLRDLRTLLGVVPELATIIFGEFSHDLWPGCFAQGEQRWPRSAAWARRLDGDPKLRTLFGRLLRAHAEGRKAIVFTQFTDTIAYIRSVLDACRALPDDERRAALAAIDPALDAQAFTRFLAETDVVSGDTDDRDRVVDRFAPFYRLRPYPPNDELVVGWESDWIEAIQRPVNVLFATDVLAEGVNLQDVSLLVNFDVHWNPVRMIQRAGRIDRRLDPRIEDASEYAQVHAIAHRYALPTPRYAWAGREGEAPVVANMILPDALEAQLALRERLATKTLAIDFTLGLEHGTGAEADWMHGYRFRGITSLNAFQQDRAIERLGATFRTLEHALKRRGVQLAWADELNAWIRDAQATDATPLVARAMLSSPDTSPKAYSRYLEPTIADGMAHWLWTTEPASELLSMWLPLSENLIGHSRRDLPFRSQASQALRPEHLLDTTNSVLAGGHGLRERSVHDPAVGAEVFQGMPALAAGCFPTRDERLDLQMDQVFILQWSVPAAVSPNWNKD